MQQNGKYPVMTSEYESANVPALYFAGQLAHGKDFRRAAGGFIHGFRYTARALFNILEHKYHGSQWPGEMFAGINEWDGKAVGLGPLGCNKGDWGMGQSGCPNPQVMSTSYEKLIDTIFSRINTASGIYQMVGVLGDGIVLQCPRDINSIDTIHATYLKEVPLDYFNRQFRAQPRLFVSFGYGVQSRSLHKSRHEGTLFQVHIWYYYGDCSAMPSPPIELQSQKMKGKLKAQKKEVFKIYEDFHTYWNTWEIRLRVAIWLHAKVIGLRPGDEEVQNEEWGPERKCDGSTAGATLKACVIADPVATQCVKLINEGDTVCSCMQNSPSMRRCMGACWRASLQLLKCADADNGGSKFQDGGEVILNKATGKLPGARDALMDWYTWGSSSDQPNSEWQGGRVDLNIANRLDMPVSLSRLRSFEASGAPQQLGVVYPGEGVRFTSHEREKWTARKVSSHLNGDTVIIEWEIDTADGLVQDIVIR